MERTATPPGGIARTAGLAVDSSPSSKAGQMVLAPLILRVSLAAIFFAHGAQKLFGLFGGAGLFGTAQGFEAMGLRPPLFLAVGAAGLEFGGSLLLIVGFLTRPVAVLLALEMLFALLAVHAPYGFFLNWGCTGEAGHGIEFNLLLVGSLFALALIGPGGAALDRSRKAKTKLGYPLPGR